MFFLAQNPRLFTNIVDNTVLADEVVKLWCNVSYQGKWGPVISWTKNGIPVLATNESQTGTPSLSQYSISVTAKPSDNKALFVCSTFFNIAVSEQNHATNSPNYTFSLQYSLNVYCKFFLTISSVVYLQHCKCNNSHELYANCGTISAHIKYFQECIVFKNEYFAGVFLLK